MILVVKCISILLFSSLLLFKQHCLVWFSLTVPFVQYWKNRSCIRISQCMKALSKNTAKLCGRSTQSGIFRTILTQAAGHFCCYSLGPFHSTDWSWYSICLFHKEPIICVQTWLVCHGRIVWGCFGHDIWQSYHLQTGTPQKSRTVERQNHFHKRPDF